MGSEWRTPKEGETITVWFSCGAASAIAAYLITKEYGDSNTVRIVNNPILEEDEDNRRFLRDVQDWIGKEIEFAINPKYPNCSVEEVWKNYKYMSGIHGAPCTKELKKIARREWEINNPTDVLVLGYTSEEKQRAERFIKTERTNLFPVLVEKGLIKQHCMNVLLANGILPPRVYSMGYPNANCIGCVKSESPTYWNLVRKNNLEVFEQRAKLSREIGTKLVVVKGKRIFLDELDPDAKGRDIKTMQVECSLFCEL